MVAELAGIQRNIDKADRTDRRVQNLAAYINVSTLKAMHKRMDGRKAVGIDKVTKEEYSSNLERNLESLVDRVKRGEYRPQPSKKVYIPKDGKGKFRPLGISSYEDKLVEAVIAEILTMVYEPKFYDFSYGFRPHKSCHMAVREVVKDIQLHKMSWVVEADIKGFFDHVSHEWLMKMLEHDIADKRFLDIIKRFLEVGVMDKEVYSETIEGTPQGNGASPALANIFLHYVLDNWFEVVMRRQSRGECYIVRYADDFICCFQYPNDAKWFVNALRKRFAKYGLTLADEKTRILEFGRYAARKRAERGLGKPETFDFLGFTFYCSMNTKRTFFRCKVKTSRKKLRGHYQYYGVTDNIVECKRFLRQTTWFLYKYLNRRSQKRSYNQETFFNGLLVTFPLVEPRTRFSLYYR